MRTLSTQLNGPRSLVTVAIALGLVTLFAAQPAFAATALSAENSLQPVNTAPKATPPPELRALEPKMELLQVSSEQISSKIEVESFSESGFTITKAPKKGKANAKEQHVAETESTDTKFSPLEGTTVARSGKSVSAERLIGNALYVELPKAVRLEGVARWLRTSVKSSESPSGDPLLAGGAPGTFTQLVSVLNDAEGIEEGTPTTVDGQQVDQFTATYAPGEFPGSALPGTETSIGKLGKPSVELNVFINASGLPVRTRISLNFSSLKSTRTADIEAINGSFPTVQAPLAKETIGEAEFVKLEEAQLRKKLRKLKKRAAKKTHGK